MKLVLRKHGNSTGLTIPTEVLARLRLKAGDSITLTETPDGFVISKSDEAFDRGLEAGRRLMKKYRNVLAALAK
jgi:putative addiction module antidote